MMKTTVYDRIKCGVYVRIHTVQFLVSTSFLSLFNHLNFWSHIILLNKIVKTLIKLTLCHFDLVFIKTIDNYYILRAKVVLYFIGHLDTVLASSRALHTDRQFVKYTFLRSRYGYFH